MPRDGSATRERILAAAEKLVIDNGYAATTVDDVIGASRSSKGAFFHHFASKAELARALVARYATADLEHLHGALALARAATDDPIEQLATFLRLFEDGADELMSAQSSCLYISVLTERELALTETTDQIRSSVDGWRAEVSTLVRAAFRERPPAVPMDVDALAEHVFATFEGAFVLCRATGDPSRMRAQLGVLRSLIEAALTERPRRSDPG